MACPHFRSVLSAAVFPYPNVLGIALLQIALRKEFTQMR